MLQKTIKNLTLSAMFLAIGIVLPFLTGQIPQIGSMMLPMHIPVLLCGLICGPWYGGVVGLVLPPLRYVLFGMPPIFPTGFAMSFELAAYGAVIGFLYTRSRWKCIIALYRSLIAAMLCGRAVWGLVWVGISGLSSHPFSWQIFFTGALLNAFPGIILQLLLIPTVMLALDKTGLVKFSKHHPKKAENKL